MICFAVFCTFVRISNTQPLFDNDDDGQTQVYDPFFNKYIVESGRFARNTPYRLNIPESLYAYHQQQQQQQFNPNNLQLAKRIIMLPRVGRRSIRSTSQK